MNSAAIFTGIFTGLSIIMSSIGARYIHSDINSSTKKELFGHPYMKFAYIYCMAFMAVRDFLLAAVVVGIYIVAMNLI